MPTPILVALCIPTTSTFKLGKLQRRVHDCTCRHRHPKYKVECYDCDIEEPIGLTSDSIIQRAFACAKKGLSIVPESDMGLGMERSKIVLQGGKIPTISSIAAAVVVFRNECINPRIILSSPSEKTSTMSQELLRLCQEEGFREHGSVHCLMDEMIKELAA